MKIPRRFTKPNEDVFAAVEWSKRDSRITDADGKVVFEMTGVEVPRGWSQLATDIMVSKYFRKAGVPQDSPPSLEGGGKGVGEAHDSKHGSTHPLTPSLPGRGNRTTGPERSARQVIHRLAGCWRHWGEKHDYFDSKKDAQAFYDELCHMLLYQMAAPNSPQWFNTGLHWAYGISGPPQGHWVPDPKTGEVKPAPDAYSHPQPHACFIQSIKDDLVNPGGIMDLWVREARLFKYGSGTGTNFSSLRGENEALSGGGKSSGLMSWLRIGDRAAGAIKSGGTTRRAAKMVCLNADHPDIEAFVNWKVREELKVAAMVEGLKHLPLEQRAIAERLGLELSYDFNGEAYYTVSGQNSNNSVRLNDSFFDAVDADADWKLTRRTDGKTSKTIKARELWDQIAFAAWRSADPGLQYDTTINAWHTCPNSGRINASNPCVTGDTLVATSTGYRRIRDLVGKSAEVINGNGERVFVDHIFKTGTKPVFELKTRSGYRVKLTADHKVRTLNRGDVPACELNRHDIIHLQGNGFADSCDVSGSLAHGFARSLISADLSEVEADLQRTGELDEFNRMRERPFEYLEPVLQWDRTTQFHFIDGIFEDAYETAEKAVNLTDDGVARVVQLVLLNFGIRSVCKKAPKRSAIQPCTLSIAREHVCKFTEQFNLALVGGGHAIQVTEYTEEGRTGDQFDSLTPCGVEDVFDLTEPRSHHFIANGLVVHNCSEYMFLDDTACNLASINLLKFYDADTRTLDIEGYEHAIRLWTIVLEISVLMASYPSEEIARRSWEFRTLGLGYANLGALLMQAGIPYDSDDGRAVCGVLTAMLTGWSYATSGEMAKELGPFPGFAANRASMLRVMRNHRRAAYGVPRDAAEYESLRIRPVAIDHELFAAGKINIANAAELLRRAERAWDEAVKIGTRCGYRNAQTTVIAPTGTIGLLMDCDTTGVEPDFALTKFKKLAGGGYFKIANQSLRPALKTLGYSPRQIDEIVTYVMGTLSLDTPMPGGAALRAAPGHEAERRGAAGLSFREFLESKGYESEELVDVENQLPTVFELAFAFNAWSMPEHVLRSLGVDVEKARMDLSFNGLKVLGLVGQQITALNRAICGTQMIEGATHLADEHLPVFDCANRCGKDGKRFIAPQGHIRMMAASQPFISGAISKTINLPAEATVQNIAAAYRLSWELGLKANALYRDGSKLSQPLSTRSDVDEQNTDAESAETALGEASTASSAAAAEAVSVTSTSSISSASPAPPASPAPLASPAPPVLLPAPVPASATETDREPTYIERIVERIVERPLRRRLPDTRASITHRFNVAGHEGYLTVGLYEDGRPGELFITMSKEGSTIGGLMDSLGTAISVALQYGVPVESLVNKFAHQRFEPMGMTANRDIPFAKSLVDYIFRWLGMEFIPGYREQNAPRRTQAAPIEGDPPRSLPVMGGERPIAPLQPGAPTLADVRRTPSVAAISSTLASEKVVVSLGDAGMLEMMSRTEQSVQISSSLDQSNAALMGDAPACDVCGAITVRNGTCYKCLNCGNSMGCS